MEEILPQETKNKINSELLNQAYEQSKISIPVSMLIALCAVLGLRGLAPLTLLTWSLFFLVLSATRIVLLFVHRYQRKKPHYQLIFWQRLYFCCVVLTAITWLLLIMLFFPKSNNWQQILCILAIAGMSSAASIAFCAVLSAAISFSIITIVPLLIQLSRANKPFDLLFVFALAVYLVYLILTSIRSRQFLENTFRLRFENDFLLGKLEELAMHDALTKINNRRAFLDIFTEALNRAARDNKLVALLYLDINNFKEINDKYGHDIGDQLLILVAERLTKSIRKTDSVARLGGDEFAVLLENISSANDVLAIINKVNGAIAQPFKTDGLIINFGISTGYSVYPDDGATCQSLLTAADKAMYRAKKNNLIFSHADNSISA
jgi:diguanylate cyclase (GGDEF)-like protein